MTWELQPPPQQQGVRCKDNPVSRELAHSNCCPLRVSSQKCATRPASFQIINPEGVRSATCYSHEDAAIAMQAYTELLPPSAVTHAVYLPFTSSSARNLVVAKTSLLQIFNVLSDVDEPQSTVTNGPRRPSEANAAPASTRTRLALVGEYPIAGIVTSLASVKAANTKTGGEALLVASKDAKISLVEWDPEAHSLSTVSIHYYEGEQLQGSPWDPDLSHWSCYLTVDPSSRCAALKFGHRQIAILPFRQAGDDLVMEDDHDLDPNEQPKQDQQVNGDAKAHQTPYSASFVLPLTALDPSILHPIDLAFLYEYREPTLGVLSCSTGGAASMLRKDVMTYTAFTLDLEQRARTPLLSVSGLPSDLFALLPLPLPVGGALLIGGNELIHVDQAGKTHGIGVNEFSKQSSAFSMTDQSELDLRLERCVITPLNSGNGDMILSLSDGGLAIVSFRMDGRSVSAITVTPVPKDRGGHALLASASCAVVLGQNAIFLGSEDADAVVLLCSSPGGQLARKRSQADMLGADEEISDEEEVEDEDDLYGNDNAPAKQAAAGVSSAVNLEDVNFVVQDRLKNLAPTSEVTISRSPKASQKKSPSTEINGDTDLHLTLPTGREQSGGLAILKHSLEPVRQKDIDIGEARRVWSVKLRPTSSEGEALPMFEHDSYVIATHINGEGQETSSISTITESGVEQRADSDFERDCATIDVGVMQDGSRLVQVSKSELRCYDTALDFPQIIPMADEDTDAELKITHTSFADQFILIVRDDASVCVLQMDKKGELEELDKSESLTSTKWSSGCLYHSSRTDETFAALLSVEDSIRIYHLPDLANPLTSYDGFPHLPPYISRDYARRRLASRVNIREICITDFGDSKANSPHLILRTSNDDIVAYQAYEVSSSKGNQSLTADTRWRKVLNTCASLDAEDDESPATQDALSARMKTLTIHGASLAIVVPGPRIKWVVKNPSGMPTVVNVSSSNMIDHGSFHSAACPHGLLVVDSNGSVGLAQLPRNVQFGPSGWAIQHLSLGFDVDAVAFHSHTGLYVVGTNSPMDFKLVEDDWHPEWAKEGDLTLKPQVAQGSVRLFHPDTASVIDTITLLPYETLLCLRVLPLEVSEDTGERKLMIAAGTAVIQGEDSATNGAIYVFEVVSVVPEPDRPETNFKLKQIVREDVRGAVTAITEIGNQGFLLHAQGQKCMVRGLKEDDSLLPVAFMDMQCYVSVLKGLPGSGLALMGDAVKGLWLGGYSPDPYKMQLFGKSRARLDVLAADFLPVDKQLFMVVADATCNLHIFEFNPEDPKSLSGQRLLQRSTFHIGHFPKSIDLLPTSYGTSGQEDLEGDTEMDGDTGSKEESIRPQYQVLITTSSGTVALLTPLSEAVYRRLGALQNYLTNVLDHPAGLNPRAYRAVENEGLGSRSILDGSLLKRWSELSVQRRQEALSRAGIEAWELRGDLEALEGKGLGF